MKKSVKGVILAGLVLAIAGVATYFVVRDKKPDEPPIPVDPDLKTNYEYVFEVVRHGARASMDPTTVFPVPTQMLTPMGMRQRFLLGRWERERYGLKDKNQTAL